MNKQEKGTFVIIESPYKHSDPVVFKAYQIYLDQCIADSLVNRKEYNFASHKMYTRTTNDDIPEERTFGIEAGLAWYEMVDKAVVYVDHGLSNGMKHGIRRAISKGKPVEYRSLYRVLTEVEKTNLHAQALSGSTVSKEGFIL